MKPTKKEIESEIAKLESLVPVGPFAQKTMESIDLQIETLRNGMDDTCDEWNDFTEEQQMLIQDTDAWKNGYRENKPSKEWGSLVE
jgi:hypothetical protein